MQLLRGQTCRGLLAMKLMKRQKVIFERGRQRARRHERESAGCENERVASFSVLPAYFDRFLKCPATDFGLHYIPCPSQAVCIIRDWEEIAATGCTCCEKSADLKTRWAFQNSMDIFKHAHGRSLPRNIKRNRALVRESAGESNRKFRNALLVVAVCENLHFFL